MSYPLDSLFEEVAFLGYYMHWAADAILDMSHEERRRWCREVSKINQKVSANEPKQTNLLDEAI